MIEIDSKQLKVTQARIFPNTGTKLYDIFSNWEFSTLGLEFLDYETAVQQYGVFPISHKYSQIS
ncbi:MAG: hypothetical protein KJ927_10420 [Candidatus Eisenbacteria bacterium]|nr:hypothetical protein [Candidatus Eisenbacteria bacterium]MBU1949115.1 hypothetical protein [Candidatus Eisenbacteria bacterium]